MSLKLKFIKVGAEKKPNVPWNACKLKYSRMLKFTSAEFEFDGFEYSILQVKFTEKKLKIPSLYSFSMSEEVTNPSNSFDLYMNEWYKKVGISYH